VLVLKEVTASLNGEADVRSEVQRSIARVKPIEDLEAVGEHKPTVVSGREPPSKGHVWVHDWRGTEIVVNMKGQ
jgi:hypothetical protein